MNDYDTDNDWSYDSTECYDDNDKEPNDEYIDKEEQQWEREQWKRIQKRHNFHQSKWGPNRPRKRA